MLMVELEKGCYAFRQSFYLKITKGLSFNNWGPKGRIRKEYQLKTIPIIKIPIPKLYIHFRASRTSNNIKVLWHLPV